jgi:hypothetical protein
VAGRIAGPGPVASCCWRYRLWPWKSSLGSAVGHGSSAYVAASTRGDPSPHELLARRLPQRGRAAFSLLREIVANRNQPNIWNGTTAKKLVVALLHLPEVAGVAATYR